MTRSLTIVFCGALAVSAAPAEAAPQTPAGPPARVAVAVGGGVAHSANADLDFAAGLWEASVRGWLNDRVAVEGLYGVWRHTDRTEHSDVILQGPNGPIGHAGSIAQETAREGRAFEINLVATGHLGQVVAFGGGGVGSLTMHRDTTTTVSDCVSSVPASCTGSSVTSSSASLTVQGLAGIDVPLTGRLSAYGGVAVLVPTRDAGSLETRVSGRLRFVLWR